jgi:pilus assembly protein Flp/PilA
MKFLIKHLKSFITSETGNSAVEYGVLLALIVLIAIASLQYMGASSNQAFSRVSSSLAK